MATVTLTPVDLEAFATIDEMKAQAMIDDALAMATLVAPCLTDDSLTADQAAAAKAVIRRAILRWNDAGTGAMTQQGAGPFQVSFDTRQKHTNLFWPTEITQLQELCRDGDAGTQAFTINTTPEDARSTDGYWSAPDTWVPL